MSMSKSMSGNDTELLIQTEHVSDVFTKIMLDLMAGSEEITVPQFQALKHIALHGSCSIGSLAHGLAVSQPAATMLVDRMLRKGLVVREPGKSDRRQAEVTLTEHGESLLQQIESERTDRLSKILSLMEQPDREQFVRSLERFIEAALKLERTPDEACLRCGIEHHKDCIVNQLQLAIVGEDIDRT